jgi:indolepyruvate ferredoxin oxidoreductase alpha subunit
VVWALGIEDVWRVDAFDVEGIEQAIKEAVTVKGRPSVVIVEGACTLIEEFTRQPAVTVDSETCNGCGLCFRVGCPALLKSERIDAKTGRPLAEIDSLLCTGCDVCLQVCPRDAIYRGGQESGNQELGNQGSGNQESGNQGSGNRESGIRNQVIGLSQHPPHP